MAAVAAAATGGGKVSSADESGEALTSLEWGPFVLLTLTGGGAGRGVDSEGQRAATERIGGLRRRIKGTTSGAFQFRPSAAHATDTPA